MGSFVQPPDGFTATQRANIDAAISSRLAASAYHSPLQLPTHSAGVTTTVNASSTLELISVTGPRMIKRLLWQVWSGNSDSVFAEIIWNGATFFSVRMDTFNNAAFGASTFLNATDNDLFMGRKLIRSLSNGNIGSWVWEVELLDLYVASSFKVQGRNTHGSSNLGFESYASVLHIPA